MKLPNGKRAFVDIRKLRDYCLDAESPKGRNKARVFASTLGLTARNSEFLRQLLLKAAANENCELGERDDYGQRYSIDVTVVTERARRLVRSSPTQHPAAFPIHRLGGWIVRVDEDFPRLTTCFVVKSKAQNP